MKIEPTDPNTLHDMRICLTLGKTPKRPVYIDPDVDSDMQGLGKEDKNVSGTLKSIFGVPTRQRRVNANFDETVFYILRLVDFSFDIGFDPSSALKQAFPDWTWQYHESANDVPLDANYVFHSCGRYITASNPEFNHRFLVTLIPASEEEPGDTFFLEKGYRAIREDE